MHFSLWPLLKGLGTIIRASKPEGRNQVLVDGDQIAAIPFSGKF
jgi:hypothetical protein